MECRICFGTELPETMRMPCRCRGSSAYVHDHCLRTYISYFPDRICRVCHERMEHPWMDMERTLVCASILLVWAAILVALSQVPFSVKCLTYILLSGLIIFHAKKQQLTYEMTFAALALSGLLFMTEPQHLPQTVILSTGLLVLLTLCLFVPVETVFLVIVFSLALTYSVLLTFAVAMRTDPAFTGLFFLSLLAFWFVFLRPQRGNDLYA